MRATAAPRGAFARSGSWAELGGREGSPGSGSSSPTTPSKSPARFGVTKEGASKGRGRLAIFLILVMIVVVGCVTAWMSAEPRRYVVILDGGSQGTRAHVYGMRVAPGPRPRHTEELGVMRVKPGLSSFESDPSGAGESLRPLYEFARRHVPSAYLARTPIVLMATAGLRSVRDDGTRDAILHSCRGTLSSSPFLFRDEWAGVIPGSKEGLYAWVAANYAADSLFARDPRHTLGVLELGGASMQVTFKVPEDQPAPPEEYTEHLHVPTVKPHESDVGTKGTNAHATGNRGCETWRDGDHGVHAQHPGTGPGGCVRVARTQASIGRRDGRSVRADWTRRSTRVRLRRDPRAQAADPAR